MDIYKSNYSDFGPTLVGEKFLELHQMASFWQLHLNDEKLKGDISTLV